MAVTLKDIAGRTGVSPSVVSTVLSGRDNGTFVSDLTRRKVLQVAEMLNYTPVRSGRPRGSRRLRRQRAEVFIGLWDTEYSPETALAVQHLQAAFHQYSAQHDGDSEDDLGLRLLSADDLPRLDTLGIMGVILLSPVPLPREAAVASIPCVMIGEIDNAPRELIQVHLDNFKAGRAVGDYLWGLGHRRIAFLAYSAHARIARHRFYGLQAAWMAAGANPNHVVSMPYEVTSPLNERTQVRDAVLRLLDLESKNGQAPTAIVCYNESAAAIAAQTLVERNCRIPQDISLVGFGDTPRGAESLIPPLTTIHLPMTQIAQEAVTQLYRLHDSQSPDEVMPRDIALPGELITRASCAPPAS